MNPESIGYIADIVQIVGEVTVIIAILFGLFELSEYRKQRQVTVAAESMHNFYSADLANAIYLIRGLPEDVTADDLRNKGGEYEKAAVLISMSFETMGLLVFERIAPIDLVTKLAGGMVVVMWRRLYQWLERVRQEQSQPSWAEWFEWLAQQCERRKRTQEPAYTKYKDWRP